MAPTLLTIAGLGVVVLIAVLVVRTLAFRPRRIDVEPARRVGLDETAVTGRLAEALRARTVSAPEDFEPGEFAALHERLARGFPRVHAALEREIVSEHSLLYRWKGSDPSRQAILLMSHLDVAPVPPGAEPRWTYGPWDGRVAEGCVWGRGALDAKCGVMSILEAVEHLLHQGFQPACDVYLAFGHDEETVTQQGNAQIARLLEARGLRFRFVLDEGGAIVGGLIDAVPAPVAFVGIAEKGYASVRLTVEQHAGHSSMPPPQTAVGILSAAVSRLERDPLPARLEGPVGHMLDYLGPEMPLPHRVALANRWLFARLITARLGAKPSTAALIRTTTAATVFHGGGHEGSLPAKAEAIVNFRILPGETPQTVLKHAEQTVADARVQCELTDLRSRPSAISDPGSSDFRMLHRTIREVCGDVLVVPGLTVVGTDSRHYARLTTNTFRFLPIRVNERDLERVHGLDERIAVDNYLEMVRFFIRLMENAAR